MDYSEIAVVALLVVLYGLVSRRMSTTVISAPMFFVIAGILLSDHALDTIDFAVVEGTGETLIEFTLMLVLFTDAMRIDLREFGKDAQLPGRLLFIGLPLAIVFGAAAAWLLLDGLVGWEFVLIAAMLAPTDAALGLPVVTSPKLPVRVRQTLNVESGLNDGLALPLVTIFLLLAQAEFEGNGIDVAVLILEQVGWGVLVGVVIGLLGGRALTHASSLGWTTAGSQQLIPLALAVTAWAIAGALDGNGFIAAFVGGLTFGVVARRHCPHIEDFTENEGQLLTSLTFLVFGGSFAAGVVGELTWQIAVFAVVSLVVVRPLAVALSLIGSHLRWQTVGFFGWFGPRGLATILFIVLVLEEHLPSESTLLAAAAWTVLLSVFAHGMTANPLTRRYARIFDTMADEHEEMPEAQPMHEHQLRVTHHRGARFTSPTRLLRRRHAHLDQQAPHDDTSD